MQSLSLNVLNYKLNIFIKDEIDKSTYNYIETHVKKELVKLNNVVNRNKKDSEISLFNVSIDKFRGSREFFNYLMDAIYWFGITGGIFNPFTVAVQEELHTKDYWSKETSFRMNRIMYDFPSTIDDLARFLKVDYTNQVVRFVQPIKVDFDGFFKGKFIDELTKSLTKFIKNFSVKFGGDAFYRLSTGEQPWIISIKNPIDLEADDILVEAKNEAISFSGSIEMNGLINEDDYTLLDPKKQEKAKSNLALVVVKAKNCLTSDVLAKSFYIGTKKDRYKLKSKFIDIKRIEIDKNGKAIIC